MEIDIREQKIYDLSPDLLKILLSDKTTNKYLRWGSDNYKKLGIEYGTDQEITPSLITGKNSSVIQPRVTKETVLQIKRTRDMAEVFTTAWICNEQNNLVDEAWFGRKNVFNTTTTKSWITNESPISFPTNKSWKDYVDARRMETSCGEAPYLVSRYDAVTGKTIPLRERIGFLDRKMRIVNENTKSKTEWLKWSVRAIQSCYGFDIQGDNVLLARENILGSFIEYYEAKFNEFPALSEIKKIANIVAWNIWQMNGTTMTAPYSYAKPMVKQMSLFGYEDLSANSDTSESKKSIEIPCRIYDWLSKKSIEFQSLVNRR